MTIPLRTFRRGIHPPANKFPFVVRGEIPASNYPKLLGFFNIFRDFRDKRNYRHEHQKSTEKFFEQIAVCFRCEKRTTHASDYRRNEHINQVLFAHQTVLDVDEKRARSRRQKGD